MDREWPQAQRDTLIAAAARVPGGETLHDLRTRSSGGTDFAQFHICVPDDQLEDLMVMMTERRIRHVPVVVDGVMNGIVSIGDVVKARLMELSAEKDALEGMIKGF